MGGDARANRRAIPCLISGHTRSWGELVNDLFLFVYFEKTRLWRAGCGAAHLRVIFATPVT
jgi:hypothetical protein